MKMMRLEKFGSIFPQIEDLFGDLNLILYGTTKINFLSSEKNFVSSNIYEIHFIYGTVPYRTVPNAPFKGIT